MCGIAGYIGSRYLNPTDIEVCLKQMGRRGPDNRDVFHHQSPHGKQVFLLHSRLSIIDLDERANQPFFDQPLAIVCNGELYNYLEIKEKLIKQGHQFKTHSDTEVLLKAFKQSCWQCLEICEGMWAFAVYNTETGSLFLARDRFGEKPLYTYEDETGLYFASEPKFIATLLGNPLKPNLNHLYRYLVNGYKALYKVEETFFEGLNELKPSTVLEIHQEGKSYHTYWKPQYQPDESLSYEQARLNVRDALLNSVKLRLRADVPLAFCMSGGVDSNTLISIAKKVYHYDVHGFTIVNTDERYEEQEYVTHMIDQLKLRNTQIPVNVENFLPRLRTLVKQHDAPVYTITYYAHWLLMQSIAEHGYRISLSGTAADELFTGYYDHHISYLYEMRQDPEFYQKSLKAWEKHIKPIVRNPYLSNPELFVNNEEFRDYIYLNADEFSDYLYEDWFEPFTETTYTHKSLLRNRMMNELFEESVPVILHEDDLNAMYYSIENRSPFLDRKLFDLCATIPTRHLIQDGCAKSLLRDSMRGIVPDKIINNRRKVGFNAPIFSFLDVQSPEVRQEILNDSPIYDYIKRDKIETLMNRDSLPNSESKFLFYFINSKLFLEEFAR